jgi:hypothetical protein
MEAKEKKSIVNSWNDWDPLPPRTLESREFADHGRGK